ncbi:MAG TPA: cytidine deaminase [Planktothrix sp.]|jgi:cytidine deaminase
MTTTKQGMSLPIYTYAELSADEQRLVDAAIEASEKSYCPYSKFAVGAALLTREGKIFTGCNIENAAWATICAERVAVTKAVSEGYLEFKAISLYTVNKPGGWPCGVCRQYMREFGQEFPVLSVCDVTRSVQRLSLADLLPHSFGPESL